MEREARKAAERQAAKRRAKARQRKSSAEWKQSATNSSSGQSTGGEKTARKFKIKQENDIEADIEAHEKRWLETIQQLAGGHTSAELKASQIPWPEISLLKHQMNCAAAISPEALTKLYRKLSLRYHPDRCRQYITKYMSGPEGLKAEHKTCELFQKLSSYYQQLVSFSKL